MDKETTSSKTEETEIKKEYKFSVLFEIEEVDEENFPKNDSQGEEEPLSDKASDEEVASKRNQNEGDSLNDMESIGEIPASHSNDQETPSPSTSGDRDVGATSIGETLKRINADLLVEFPAKKPKPELFTVDKGPKWYSIANEMVTPPIITKNLPRVFEALPIFGKPKTKGHLDKFYDDEIRNFIGCDLDDEEFKELGKYCSIEHLKTGKELNLKWDTPSLSILSSTDIPDIDLNSTKLCTTRKYKMRNKINLNPYLMRLKYRGLRMLPLSQEGSNEDPTLPCELEPGKDLIFRVRVYRPFIDHLHKDRNTRSRSTVFSCDVVLLGRRPLSDLRDRIACNNDHDMRVDVSHAPDAPPAAAAKEVFPSGFLFINNTFYVDTREGCVDNSAVIRTWARRKGIGDFPVQDMCSVNLEDIVIKLGHPEVYVHQGACEHVFTFSEVRCVTVRDPLRRRHYPCHSAVTHNQTIYCTTCAEFGAKWIVSGCRRVPFDPAFFCDTCFRQYLYKDGTKIGEFKAYAYIGNELNPLKPFG